MRYILGLILKKEGFLTAEAENGQIALEMVHSFQPDTIICDFNMPVMNGLEFLQEARLMQKSGKLGQFRAIMHTSETDPTLRAACDRVGIDGWLQKPISSDKILGLVKEVGSKDKSA